MKAWFVPPVIIPLGLIVLIALYAVMRAAT
ncbi:hypothetical protein E9232_001962 [Inquilinus ginsengisoli]|jgi:hypothetical protein|uniref:Uncharacterized protein n=1 Tax=Inquilinus ginsengisoli TaxID=363840 RepID=A0ABU1JLE7_9PROT|nr:hypothetical protein [Inquilinus ginsengisoli]